MSFLGWFWMDSTMRWKQPYNHPLRDIRYMFFLFFSNPPTSKTGIRFQWMSANVTLDYFLANLRPEHPVIPSLEEISRQIIFLCLAFVSPNFRWFWILQNTCISLPDIGVRFYVIIVDICVIGAGVSTPVVHLTSLNLWYFDWYSLSDSS